MPLFFPTAADFRVWLRRHHEAEKELIVGFYRKGCGRPSITWPESVQEALCFGWIDGVRRKIDDESYTIRFTPRKPSSIWSKINLATMEGLLAEGRVASAGRKVYEARDRAKTNRYSFERAEARFSREQENLFRRDKKAWSFWTAQVPSYQKPATWWVVSAKQPATQEKRLKLLIEHSAKGVKIPQLRRTTDKKS